MTVAPRAPARRPAAGGRPRGSVRMIGGQWRSRRLAFPARPDLRPTPDRVRETLFNWLGQDLHGLRCLDLFAGSGALGFEAASRGAARVVMVESDREACAALVRNRRLLDAGSVEVIGGDAFAYLDRPREQFDVVFLDPPFRQNSVARALAMLAPHLAAGARVYVEASEPVALPGPWRELKAGRAGQVHCQLLEYHDHDRSGIPRDV